MAVKVSGNPPLRNASHGRPVDKVANKKGMWYNKKKWVRRPFILPKRMAELDELIKKLYEGNATGKIPDKHINRLLVEYDIE